jgi:hypothetical protein
MSDQSSSDSFVDSSEDSVVDEAFSEVDASSEHKPDNMSLEEWEEFNLKVNGKEITERVNLKDKERITRALQMEKAAQQAFQERSITAKQLQEIQGDVEEFLEQFSENPLSIVMNPEFNLTREQKRQIAEAILKEDLEDSQKSPEQLALEDTKRRYEELLAEKEEIEQQRREEEQSRLQQEAAVQLEHEIVQAIEVGQLPKSTYISKKLADLAYIAYANGIDLSMQDLIPFVKQQYKKDIAEMMGVLSDEEVEMLISKERIRNIRTKQIQTVKPKNGALKSPLKTEDMGVSSKKDNEPKKLRAKDFFNSLRG